MASVWTKRTWAGWSFMTLMAVGVTGYATLRVYLPVSPAVFEISFDIAYPLISFACWVPNAIVAEWLVRR